MNKNTVFLTAINIINYFSGFSTLCEIKFCKKFIRSANRFFIKTLLSFIYQKGGSVKEKLIKIKKSVS